MDDVLLTSADAAQLLGVSPSTVKRWVDDGTLRAERTAGGHRRIPRQAVDSLRFSLAGPAAGTTPSSHLVDFLLGIASQQAVDARLLMLRSEAGSAAGLAEVLRPAIVEIGARWRAGLLHVVEEHLASERLSRSLARLSEWVPLEPGAPRALLATAPGDDHTLGLSLVELCLREAGWETLWLGRNTPVAEVVRAVRSEERRIQLVVISASAASDNERTLASSERAIGAACEETGARLLVGGSGAWPRVLRHAHRIDDFRELERFARQLRITGR